MKLPKMLSGVLISTLLIGCATTLKSEMDEEQYVEYARLHTALSYCGASGLMDAGTAAQGLTYIKVGLNKYAYYPERLKSNIDYVEQYEEVPTSATCNQVAMLVQGRKQQIAVQNQHTKDNRDTLDKVNNNWPKPIVCNQVGGSTLCTAY